MNQVEKLRRWLFPIGGGAYGVKPLKPINPNERSSLSVRFGRFTINASFRYIYRGLDCINCWADQKSAKKIIRLSFWQG